MPCRSDYLEANSMEIEHSKVLALLEELRTGKLPEFFGNGYYSEVYSRTSRAVLDEGVSELCSKLQAISDIKKYSLEMQMWWRDHQKADRERLERMMEKEKEDRDREKLISTLTPYEKKLLDIKI